MTLEDVATAAGVSPKTVSRVMNNEPNVRPTTREKVLKVAQQLGYRPNRAARSLAGSKSYTISHLHNNPNQDYTERANAGIYRACRDYNYQLFLVQLEDFASSLEQQVEDFLSSHEVDGVILSPPAADNETLIGLFVSKDIPVVTISPAIERSDVASVFINDRRAAAVMTQHLIDLGHSSIGFIAGPEAHGAASARGTGFEETIKAAGLSLANCPQRRGDFTYRSGLEAAADILSKEQRPSAIFAANDLMAAGAMTAAFQAGLSIPDDISISGFDASYIGSILWPPLATVRQPVADMAQTAAEWLITGELFESERAKRREFPFELVVRPSTSERP